ncbi:hypothetical protein A6R68_22849, partial [Neotoma lepida]
MFVIGLNYKKYDNSLKVVSNASCTTNCSVTLTKVIHDNSVEELMMTTGYAITNALKTVDGPCEKLWQDGHRLPRTSVVHPQEQPVGYPPCKHEDPEPMLQFLIETSYV